MILRRFFKLFLVRICFAEYEYGQKIYIDHFFFETSNPDYCRRETYTLKSLIQCASLCLENCDWCFAYCYDKNKTLCLLTNMLVSPYHQDNPGRSVKCHTHLKRDLAFGSDVTSSPISEDFYPNGTVDILAKGIHNYNEYQTCTGMYYGNQIYILFDLKKSYRILEIRITTQSYDWDKDLPKNAEIKIGNNEPVNENFSDYVLFRRVPMDLKPRTTYTLHVEQYIQGRYVVIIADPQTDMTLCYFQIFE